MLSLHSFTLRDRSEFSILVFCPTHAPMKGCYFQIPAVQLSCFILPDRSLHLPHLNGLKGKDRTKARTPLDPEAATVSKPGRAQSTIPPVLELP